MDSNLVRAYLEKLQSESENGFHPVLRVWTDNGSSVAKVLNKFAEELEEEAT